MKVEQIELRKHTERQRLSTLDKQAKIIPTLRRPKTNLKWIQWNEDQTKHNTTWQNKNKHTNSNKAKNKWLNENPIRTNKYCALELGM